VTQNRRDPSTERVRFTLSGRERDLLLRRTFLDEDVERRLRLAVAVMGSRLAVDLTMDEVDDLAASVAAEANHCDEPKILRTLDAIYDRLSRLESRCRSRRARVTRRIQ
jgi:hypothetical protein